jgi:hypothetical protein
MWEKHHDHPTVRHPFWKTGWNRRPPCVGTNGEEVRKVWNEATNPNPLEKGLRCREGQGRCCSVCVVGQFDSDDVLRYWGKYMKNKKQSNLSSRILFF